MGAPMITNGNIFLILAISLIDARTISMGPIRFI